MSAIGQMWIPFLGVVTAALIAGFVSLINLMIAKDQKITEFRQDWINSLRNEISVFVSLTMAISSMRHVIDYKQSKRDTAQDALDDMRDVLKGEGARRSECYNRILLLLKPSDDGDLISRVKDLYLSGAVSSTVEHSQVVASCEGVVEETQRLLKTEWERVKRGEPFYRWVKICTLVAVILLSMSFVAVGVLNRRSLVPALGSGIDACRSRGMAPTAAVAKAPDVVSTNRQNAALGACPHG